MNDIIIKLKYICEHYRVCLYGAGMYARTLYAFMKEQNIGQIEQFIVSKGAPLNDTVFGKNVIELGEYVLQKNLKSKSREKNLIILAVSEQYYAEIIEELKNRKINQYVTLSNEEWQMVIQATQFEGIVPQKNIAILMYHRIIDSDYNFWKLNISPAIFEKHMKYISENYNVLRLEEIWNNIVQPNQKYVVITFDDGYVDNFRFALPILEKYQVPATVFVSTDLIDTNEMYWWDELEKIFILDSYVGEFVFKGISYRVVNSDDSNAACIAIRNRIKEMNPAEQKKSMRELREVLGVEKPSTSELRCVNTNELRAMAESQYITIGGHTKSHLSMGKQHSEELLRSELEESLEILKRKTGKRINVFAYPFGGKEDWCDTADRIVAECGIAKSVLVGSGNINASDTMYNLPRHMVFTTDNIEKKMIRIWGIYG